MITAEYADYLQSEAWKKKREQRLIIGKFRCAACNSASRIEVHHLTYRRIFNEDMSDLIPLCGQHHSAAEKLVKEGRLPRSDDVLFLATETIRLLLQVEKKNLASRQFTSRRCVSVLGQQIEFRNDRQYEMLNDPYFVSLIAEKDSRKFKKMVRAYYRGKGRGTMISNAWTLRARFIH